MEYYKDLLRKNKNSKARIIFGIIFLLISIFWIINKYIDHTTIRIFDWIYSTIFFLNGAVHILEGSGISSDKLFGKAYLRINNEFIDFKPTILQKAQKIFWDDIHEIELKPTSIVVASATGKNLSINYGVLGYASVQELKDAISKIAHDKQCKLIF